MSSFQGLAYASTVWCFLATASHAATTEAAPHLGTDIVGKWQWVLPGSGCVETVEFFTNGTRHVVSGKERSDSKYVVELTPNSRLRKLVVTTTKDYGGEDCGGSSEDDTGQTWSRFFDLSPRKDQMILCAIATGDDCIGPYRRLKER